MAARRQHLAQRRKAVGFTQEGLAEQLGVDAKTVRRWESGETEDGPQPWLRPKLAACLQVSVEELGELLDENSHEGPCPPIGVPSQGCEQRDDAETLTEARTGVFLQLIVDGRPILVPLGEEIDTTDWSAMSPANRRSVLGYGFATALASGLGAHSAGSAQHQNAVPITLTASSDTSWATATYKAVLNPMDAARRAVVSPSNGAHDLSALRTVIDRAMQVSLRSDYGALEESLPTLIGCVETPITTDEEAERALCVARSDVYAVVGWTLIKADNPLGAWIAAQRAIEAAEQTGDLLRVAAATRCLAEVHMRARNFEEATRTAFLAAVQLEGAPPESKLTAASLRGAALLSAAAASARRGDSREAYAALQAASGCANEVGQDRSDLATVFGPTNMAIHQVAIAIELGDAKSAIRHIPAVQLDRMLKPLTERRARFLIDVARCYAHLRDDAAAIAALLQADTIAPDELRHHRLTHELVLQLLARERRNSGLRALAGRCGLLT